MDLIVKSPHSAEWGNRVFRCAVGRNGFIAAHLKKEGDGATPIGRWGMREVFYRPDRETPPQTILPLRPLSKSDGWCDASADPNYNRMVKLPYPASAEELWRDDHLYDLIVVLGYNADPVAAGKGSAIFLHIARPDFSPSSGCVLLTRDDLLIVLREASAESAVVIAAGA